MLDFWPPPCKATEVVHKDKPPVHYGNRRYKIRSSKADIRPSTVGRWPCRMCPPCSPTLRHLLGVAGPGRSIALGRLDKMTIALRCPDESGDGRELGADAGIQESCIVLARRENRPAESLCQPRRDLRHAREVVLRRRIHLGLSPCDCGASLALRGCAGGVKGTDVGREHPQTCSPAWLGHPAMHVAHIRS